MEAMINQNPFGAHGDIMGASPEDDQGKATLCEEIKNRARAEFGRKNLPQAEMLYSKGLKIKPEDATLHSNLAAVRLGLNKTQAALENAEEAVRLDPTYAKGHYRKGQALMALSRPADAAEAFRAGAALEPESKLWGPLVRKAVKAAEAAVAAPSKQVAAASSRTSAGATKNTPTASSVSSRSSAAGGEKMAAGEGRGEGVAKENGGVGGGGDGRDMKGYKKTVDGRVTTYFNNDLTEEAKALIGDIAPKRLDAVGGDAGQEAAGGDVSVWNKAGTWESRDMTSWAKQRLKELLLGVEFDASEGVVEVVAVEKIEGDAEISLSRGKKRFLFDFRLELKWEASDLECGPAKGVLVYPDFGQDCNGVYDAECRVDSSTPFAAKAYVDRHIRAERSGLREAVLARLVTFISEFNSK